MNKEVTDNTIELNKTEINEAIKKAEKDITFNYIDRVAEQEKRERGILLKEQLEKERIERRKRNIVIWCSAFLLLFLFTFSLIKTLNSKSLEECNDKIQKDTGIPNEIYVLHGSQNIRGEDILKLEKPDYVKNISYNPEVINTSARKPKITVKIKYDGQRCLDELGIKDGVLIGKNQTYNKDVFIRLVTVKEANRLLEEDPSNKIYIDNGNIYKRNKPKEKKKKVSKLEQDQIRQVPYGLIGKSSDEVKRLLLNNGIWNVDVKETENNNYSEGTVVDISTASGSKINRNNKVTIYVAKKKVKSIQENDNEHVESLEATETETKPTTEEPVEEKQEETIKETTEEPKSEEVKAPESSSEEQENTEQ